MHFLLNTRPAQKYSLLFSATTSYFKPYRKLLVCENKHFFIFNFVDTPRNLRGVSTKLNIIFFHHANFQEINY